MGAQPVYPWAQWITSFTLMSNRSQEEEEHTSKDLHRLHNLPRFVPSPTTPTLQAFLAHFLLSLSLFWMCFILLSVCSLCVPCCHTCTCTSSTALPSFPLIPAHTLAKTAVCRLYWLDVMRFSFAWRRAGILRAASWCQNKASCSTIKPVVGFEETSCKRSLNSVGFHYSGLCFQHLRALISSIAAQSSFT